MENPTTPAFENLKAIFKNNTNGLDADQHPADFAAFLFIKQQEKIKETIKKVNTLVKSNQSVTPKELESILEELLIK